MFELQFHDAYNTIRRREASGCYIQVSMKEAGKFDGPLVAAGSTVSQPVNDETPYSITVSLDTDEIAALLLVDGNDANDVSYVDVLFEIAYSDSGGGGGATDWVRSQTVYARIYNAVTDPTNLFPSVLSRFVSFLFSDVDLDTAANFFLPARTGFNFTATAYAYVIKESLAAGTAPVIAIGESADGIALTTEIAGTMLPTGGVRYALDTSPANYLVTDPYVYVSVEAGGATSKTADIVIYGWEVQTT